MASQPFVHTAVGTTGTVAAGAKVYCYVKDTVTPQTAYMNSGLSTPAANPYIADAAGHIQFYFSDLLNFTFLVKSSDDADTLLEVDFTASGTAFSITYADLGNLNAFNDAWAAYLETIHFNQIWLGAYDGATAYVENDAVSYGGSSYICTAATTGNLPTNTSYWDVLAEKGDSAYQVAVDQGYVGTELEWLETLIGTSSRDEQVFSGDAIDTTFVFTGMVITDKLNISIYVDGIIQRESDYGLSNDGTDTTITFTSAPPLGTNNIVMRGAVLTGGGSTYTDEMVRDVIGTALTAGTGITVTPNDGADTITVAVDTTTEAERIRDVIGTALVAGTNITLTVNDAGDTITIDASGGGGSYTTEEAQDAASLLFTPDDGDIDFTYNDATPSITASLKTSISPQFAGVNLGHATNTTLAQGSVAGVAAVEGVDLVDVSRAQTLTTKTLTTPTINGATLSGTLSGAHTLSGLVSFTAGADMTPAATPSTTAVGYLGAPQRSISAADTFALTDAGKHLYHPAADTTARVWTIPANASVAYPIGTVIGIVNEAAAGVITLAITSDTLRWGSSTGSRSLAANSTATLLKVTSTLWRLTGDGIT